MCVCMCVCWCNHSILLGHVALKEETIPEKKKVQRGEERIAGALREVAQELKLEKY